MKKYIGTKVVSAEPMDKGTAITHKLVRENNLGGDPKAPGYHVVYEDGYHSWSPAEVFEASYKIAETPVDRMNIEWGELSAKIIKLNQFILKSEKFKELDEKTRAALIVQGGHMGYYANILLYRLEAMNGTNENNLDDDQWVHNLTFGSALELLMAGYAVRRYGWNGKGMYVVKQVSQEIGENIIPKMSSLPDKAKELLLKGKNKCIRYRNQMLLVQPDGTADSWVPSSSDVFADDWELVI